MVKLHNYNWKRSQFTRRFTNLVVFFINLLFFSAFIAIKCVELTQSATILKTVEYLRAIERQGIENLFWKQLSFGSQAAIKQK